MIGGTNLFPSTLIPSFEVEHRIPTIRNQKGHFQVLKKPQGKRLVAIDAALSTM